MRTIIGITDRNLRDEPQYALRREGGWWPLTFEGRQSSFTHEPGATYVAWLLLHPPRQPIHALGLALGARTLAGRIPGAAELLQQRYLGLDEAEAVRSLRRRERELETVLDDDEEIEPVKAEALRELEAIAHCMRQSPWRSRECVQKCARAVSLAIRGLQARLAGAVDAEGNPDPVLQGFARHLYEHLLMASDGGALQDGQRVGAALPGWFTYRPPPDVIWSGDIAHDRSDRFCGPIQGDMRTKKPDDRRRKTKGRGQRTEGGAEKLKWGKLKAEIRGQRTEAVGYLARFLCAWLTLALVVTGCMGTRPLKGGKALMTRTPAGVVEQTLLQGENASQATKQDQESVKVRTYTVPAGLRMEQSSATAFHDPQYERNDLLSLSLSPSKGERVPKAGEGARQPSTFNSQPSTTLTLSAPMPVVEREESRARAELSAAQKDTARELGAKLSSLKGIVWVGVGLFVFGLASLVWPPLKAIIGSVTTSAALMLGGVALMVLPSMVVGNELLILGIVGIAVGGWFLAHRHGELRGIVAASTPAQTPASNQSSVTANQGSVASGQGQGAAGKT